MEGSTLTLPRFYFDVYAPTYLVGARPRTFEAYKDAVTLWSRLVDEVRLCSIDVITLAKFKSGLMAGRSPATVNKHLGAVNAILTKAGPPGPRNRDALGILDRVPWVKPLKEIQRAPTPIAFGQIDLLYHAAGQMKLPGVHGVAAPAWWRALLVMAYTCALRRGTLLAIRWSDVDLDH
ncbi:MAG: hypothetical protein JNM18_12735, partial [Planctomycetaceae bacterium]|nr:hypothetical protein [Planctomycetaceae bacterium]